jgi:hypothetical protein
VKLRLYSAVECIHVNVYNDTHRVASRKGVQVFPCALYHVRITEGVKSP